MTSLRRTGTVARGLLALAVLVALVGGVPVALLVTIGNPVPEGWRLDQPLSPEATLGLLGCVAWVLWVQLVACVLVEIVAELRLAMGRSAGWLSRVPGTFGGQQALARSLVQAVVAVGLTGATMSMPSQWPSHAEENDSAAPAPIALAASRPNAESPAFRTPQQRASRVEVVTVASGDSLWSTAEAHLGSGERWREIALLNVGREVSEGIVFDEARSIEPGWRIAVPAESLPAPARHDVTVERGDSLWALADEEYGQGRDWPRIYEANKDKIEDPHWIYPGQTFEIPRHPAEPDRSPEAPSATSSTPLEPNTSNRTGVPTASSSPRASSSDGSSLQPVANPGRSAEATNETDETWHLDGATIARSLLGGGGFLAAAMLPIYIARRRAQGRNRRSGRVTLSVAPPLRAEDKALRSIGSASLAPAAFFDAALRDLAQRAAEQGLVLPEAAAARIDARILQLFLSAPTFDAPSPWTVAEDGMTWTLSREEEPPSSERMSPYPAMVTLGDDAGGGTVFLDVESAGLVQIVGGGEAGSDLARFMAAELALNPWTDVEGVTLIGVAEDVVPLNPGRLFLDAALDIDQITKTVRHMRENVSLVGQGVLACRVLDWRNAWVPSVTIAAIDEQEVDAASTAAASLLDEVQNNAGRSSVALVAVTVRPLDERGVILTVTSAGALRTPWGKVTANRLTQAETSTLVEMIEDADREGDEAIPPLDGLGGSQLHIDAAGALLEPLTEVRSATGEPHSVLPHPDLVYLEAAATTSEDLAELAPAVLQGRVTSVLASDPELDVDLAEWESESTDRPRLRVLGPVHLRAAGERTREVDSRPAYFTELAAYLNCHPNGLTPNQFAADFGIQNNTLHTRLGQLRKWLSTQPAGEWYLPNAQLVRGQKVYRLEGILADDDLFRRLRARASARGPAGIEDLRRALELVTGPPYDQQRSRGYGWLVDTPQDHYLTAAIVDVAHIVATHALANGDPALALWAAEKAILAAPAEDKPRLDLARAIKAMGRADEAEAYVAEQVFSRADDDRAPRDPSARTRRVLGEGANG